MIDLRILLQYANDKGYTEILLNAGKLHNN